MPYTSDVPFAKGSATSYEAALEAKHFVCHQGLLVYRAIKAAGAFGATQKELAAKLNLGRPSICARVNALEADGAVEKTAARRGGCAVYKAAEQTERHTLQVGLDFGT